MVVRSSSAPRAPIALQSVFGLLNRYGLLSAMPETSREKLLALGRIQPVKAGTTFQHFGDPGKGVFCILSGQFRFAMLDHAGNEVLMALGHAGMWFGAATLIDGGGTMVAARAVIDSELFAIPQASMQQLMRADSEIALFLARMGLHYLRISMSRVLENATLSSAALVARMLMHLGSEAAGVPGLGNIIRISQEELATMCGASRKTVSRVLQGMKRSGLVGIDYNSIEIKDMAALAVAAGVSAEAD